MVVSTLPAALSDKSLYCKSPSGSGKKTLCSISVLNKVAKEISQNPKSKNTLQALIVVNQKGLAAELGNFMQQLAKYLNVKVFPVFGGIAINLHTELIKKEKPEILVGTPGRLCQLFENGVLNVEGLKTFVIINADVFFENQNYTGLIPSSH